MKKKVTAPLSYDPGKGRPKEHLAYLNWQEMQQLRRLNGDNMERGPRGLPSFPPADAKGSSSKSTSSSSRGPGGGSLSAPARTAPSSGRPSSGSYGGGGRDTGGKGNVGMGKAPSSGKAASESRGGGPSSRQGRSVAVSPRSYTPSPAALRAVTRGPGSVSGMIPGNRDPIAQLRSLQGITNSINDTFGTSYTPGQVSKMARAVAGEAAGEDSFGRAAVANTMFNRIALAQEDPKKFGYMGGTSPEKLLKQYDATGMRKGTSENAVYKSAVPGTSNFQAGLKALNDAMNPISEFSRSAPSKVLNATHYYNPSTSNPKWGTRSGKEFQQVGRHVFGNAEPTESSVSLARSSVPSNVNVVATGDTPQPASGFSRMSPAAQLAIKGALAAGKILGSPSDYKIPSIKEASAFVKRMPDSVKQSYMQAEAQKLGEKLPSYLNAGLGAIGSGLEKFAGSRPTVQQASAGPPAEAGGEYVSPSQAGMTEEQEKVVKQKLGPAKVAIRTGAGLVGTVVPFAGLAGGQLAGGYEKNVERRVNAYVAASPSERAAMEAKDPAIIGWARAIGIQPQNDYSVYQAWAEKSGLRGPEETRGEDRAVQYAGGIGALPSATTPVGTSEQTGSRPYEYYQWDVGVNIPSPTDPNYTSYQEYLRRRAQAQA